MQKKKTPAGRAALGGVLAALAVVTMGLGGLIPIMTYVTPMVCALLLEAVRILCGETFAWAWYGAVGLLGFFLSPDREAAALFLFLGYYPIVRPKLERWKLPWLWKGLYFNLSIAAVYLLLLKLLGLDALGEEFRAMGGVLLAVMLLMGNVVFLLLDKLLRMQKWIRKR